MAGKSGGQSPPSRRFALTGSRRISRQRLDCACFSTALGRGVIVGYSRVRLRFDFGFSLTYWDSHNRVTYFH